MQILLHRKIFHHLPGTCPVYRTDTSKKTLLNCLHIQGGCLLPTSTHHSSTIYITNLCYAVDLKSSHGLLPNPVASCCFRFCCIIFRSSGMVRHCHHACHSSVLKNYATLLVCRFQCDRSVSPHGWHVSRTWRRGMPHSIAMRLSWILESLTIHHGSLGLDSLHVLSLGCFWMPC